MHRTLTISIPATATDALSADLLNIEDVIGLSVSRGASLKPPGDVVTVHVLNRGADAVLWRVAEIDGPVSVVTAEAASFIDPAHNEKVEKDRDEAIWEEMETGLRHQGQVTPNYVTLMALGGAVAAVGLVSEPVPQVIAFVASAIIAPGFEPVAKIALGLVLRRWRVAGRGVYSAVIGYAVLILAAALAFWALQAAGAVSHSSLLHNPEVERIAKPGLPELLVSACGAVAGIVMLAAYRKSVIAGPLIALTIIPAAALIGMAPVAGSWEVAWEGLERLAIDLGLIVISGVVVVALKQAAVHKRQPMA
jgi:hypothetical protein